MRLRPSFPILKMFWTPFLPSPQSLDSTIWSIWSGINFILIAIFPIDWRGSLHTGASRGMKERILWLHLNVNSNSEFTDFYPRFLRYTKVKFYAFFENDFCVKGTPYSSYFFHATSFSKPWFFRLPLLKNQIVTLCRLRSNHSSHISTTAI